MNNKILWEYFVFLTTTVCVEQTRTSYERPFDISSISRSLHIQSLSVDEWEVFAVKATSMASHLYAQSCRSVQGTIAKNMFFSSHLPMTNHKGSQSPYQPLWRTKCFIVSDYAAHRQHGKQSLISVRSLARHVPSQVLGRTTVVICESEEDHIEDGKVKHGDRVDNWGKTWLFRHHLGWVLCLSHIFALRLWRNVQIFSIRLWNYSSSSWHLRDNWQYTWSHILKITVGINSYIHMKQNFHWKMGFFFHFSQKLRLGGGGWPFC